MLIVDTLAPLVLLIVLGAGLAHIRFLGEGFIADLNKLAFWIALPALLFRGAAHAEHASPDIWLLLGVVLSATLLICGLGWVAARVLALPRQSRGTMMQSAFRGNLAYIGIPVVTYSLADSKGVNNDTLATAAIVMALTMAFYNVLAVIVLQSSRPASPTPRHVSIARPILTNPLMLSGLTGLLVPFFGLKLPGFLDRTLESLGNASVPIALLCIGGSLATVQLVGRRVWIVTAALLKVAVLPMITYGLARLAGLALMETRIAMVYSTAPTAVAAYIMVKQMDGDEPLASGSITLSTLLSTFSLAAALWLTR